jgi:hypothetical protein
MRLVAPQFKHRPRRQWQIDWPPVTLANETLSIDRSTIEDGRATLTTWPASRGWCSISCGSPATFARSRSDRGKGEIVTAADSRIEISAGRAGPEGVRLNLSLKTDERPLTIEADGLLALSAAGLASRARWRCRGRRARCWPAAKPLRSSRGGWPARSRLTSPLAALDEVSFQYGRTSGALILPVRAS